MAAALYQVFAEQFDQMRAYLEEARADLLTIQAEAPAKEGIEVTLDWAEQEGLLLAALGPLLDDVFAQAQGDIADRYKQMGVALSWEIYDTSAAARAQEYKFNLIRDLNASTRDQLGKTISQWIRSDADFEVLVEEVRRIVPPNPYPVLRDRARLIAQTETTRIYADSRMAGMQAAGLHQMVWQTAKDELVCPRCGPLHDKTGSIERGVLHEDTGTFYKPPAHPGCRCWLTEDVDEMQSMAGMVTYAVPINLQTA